MSREVKFRVWSGKSFLYSYKGRGLSFSASRKDSDMEAFGCYDLEQCSQFGFIILQYTGILDKNGKEIFEGDIVQYNRRSSYDGMNFEVAWSEDSWGWSLICRKSGDYLVNEKTPDGYRYKFIEVVGNIYENPELCQ